MLFVEAWPGNRYTQYHSLTGEPSVNIHNPKEGGGMKDNNSYNINHITTANLVSKVQPLDIPTQTRNKRYL